MTQSRDQLNPLNRSLIEAYENLPRPEKTMVQLFSVVYEPINRTMFLTCWNSLDARAQQGVTFTSLSLKPYLDRLSELGILTVVGGTGLQCHPSLVEIATRDAVNANQFEQMVQASVEKFSVPKHWKDGPTSFRDERQLVRMIRIGLYRNDVSFIDTQLEDYSYSSYRKPTLSLADIYIQICDNPFDPDWFRTLPPELYEVILLSILNRSIVRLIPADDAFALLQNDTQTVENRLSLSAALIEQLLLRGQLNAARQALERVPTAHQPLFSILWGHLALIQGDHRAAIAYGQTAVKALNQSNGKRRKYVQSLSGLFFILALLKEATPSSLATAVEYASIARQSKHWLSHTYALLEHVIKIQQGELSRKAAVLTTPIHSHRAGHSLETLIGALVLYWVDRDQAKQRLPQLLEAFYNDAEASGYYWLAKSAIELLAIFKPRSPKVKQAKALLADNSLHGLTEVIQPKEPWELCLNALAGLQKEVLPLAAVKSEANLRLAWTITFYPSGCTIQPREQSWSAKGTWSKGRPIALKRLKDDASTFRYLTPQDLQVCAQIKVYSQDWGSKTEYGFGEKAIAQLVGHPYVFWTDAPTTRVEVVMGEPELLVKKGKDGRLTLQFSPQIKDNHDIITVKESPTRLKVIEITPEHRRIAEILGQKNRLEVPATATDRVLSAIHAVSSIVTVQSDIGGGGATEEVISDPKPHLHLLPVSTGLKVAMLCRPFAQGGSYYHPGSGGETVIAEIDGKRLQTTRSLTREKTLANAAIAACPTLSRQDKHDNEWLLDDPEDCLELLLELQALNDTVILEWPEGETLRIKQQATLKDFKLSIKRQNDWFATDGELRIGDQQVLDMQQLMQLLAQTPSRFIPLGEGQFLALTQEFRKRLDELRAYADTSGKGLRLHPLAALAVEDWIDEVGNLNADKHWKAHIQRLKEIQTVEPKVPSTLQAELRDYQLDGFRWLFRLAHWGVGACLADDMGLGKTLQALAVILTRAGDGATLVIAPTSVGMNWVSEAQRFAPTLNVLQFGSGDRQMLLDQLKPFDLLVCSYGLLQQEDVAAMLSKIQWQTIVLDEAQSIKNFATKRSQAAMALQGRFKLLTTGTPIENHLGELWNLFRFINPGLLGSLDTFNQRFANPIERYGDRQARNQLKKLIQPFLLRRTKTQVLEELPSRTEILLHVDLSTEELAFYEALRRDAIAKLSESDATAGAKHLQVLAEIMRLRRACCNTRLVKPDISLPSSKLQLFGEILTELVDNSHKALVFSQFVDHLQIIRTFLDEQKIPYQYLDGSTPAAERKKRVDAFQSGTGDVFLISLKAGGTGLNLTAADYVIHMDPWWNPAVEDQASDRAHRIGQQRPVTIYRLVAKNTIEDKIVELHHHKRDLADSLLEGTEISGKISTDQLLRLISEH